VAVVFAAVLSSAVAGVSAGVVLAVASRGNGYRARSSLREHAVFARRSGTAMAVAASIVCGIGVYAVTRERLSLVLTCVASAFLLALASWSLLVEEDDDYPGETSDEPNWWPDFERQFHEWADRDRVPAGHR
jgi:hypothetical protein